MKIDINKFTMKCLSSTILLISILAFTSCGYSEKKKELARQQAIADSLKTVAAEETARIEKARIDSLALFAWGDAKFGMSPKEVKSTNAFRNSEKYIKGTILENGKRSRSFLSLGYDDERLLEENLKLLRRLQEVHACFRSDELSIILIRCLGSTANYIDDIVHDANIWIANFSEKYGKPTYLKEEEVNIFNFNNGREFAYARWEIGDKLIKISMGEEYSGSEYYYQIYISHEGFPTKPDVEEQESIRKYEEKLKQEKANYF